MRSPLTPVLGGDGCAAAGRDGFAYGRDGTPIHYRVTGSGGRPAVLCDGIGCDGYVWKYIEPLLLATGRFDVVHWHYRGHGQTPPPREADRLSITDLADDLELVLGEVDEAGPDARRAVLFGHSMGVQVCLEAFRRFRHRLGGLVLMCGSYGNPLRTFKGKKTLEQVLPALRTLVGATPTLARYLVRAVTPTDLAYLLASKLEVNADLLKKEDFFPYLYGISHVEPKIFVEMLAYAGRHSAGDLLEQIDVPTLIVAGDRDGFTPAWLSHEMNQRIPGSELLVIKDGSHTAPLERRDLVEEALGRFLAKV